MIFFSVFKLCPDNLRRKFWWLFAGMLLLAFGETATVGLLAFYAASVSDPQASYQAFSTHGFIQLLPETITGLFSSPKALIGALSGILIAAVLVKNIYRGLILHQTARFGALVEAHFGGELLTSFLYRNYQWHLKQNSANLTQLVGWRAFLGRSFFSQYLNILCEICMLVVLLAALLAIQPLISLLFIVIQGSAGYIVYRVLKKELNKTSHECQQYDIEINRNSHMAIHGVKDVQITGTAMYFIQKFETVATQYAHRVGWQRFWQETPLLALESIGFILIAGSIVFMLFVLGYSPLETTGTTALLAVTAWRTLPAFNRIISAFAQIQSSLPYVNSVLEALPDKKYRRTDLDSTQKLQTFDNKIEFKNLCFSYEPQQPVLTNFNLTVTKGQSIGVMGPSGCGKSTLVDLITGLLEPQQGEIVIDGQLLTKENIPYWRERIGYVPQSPYIFDGTLARNIAFGVPGKNIDEDQVKRACAMAAIDFLDQLPQGINTTIGERGIRLSGGQCQRIAIARALYRNPELIVFDEATSALDDANDRQIRKLINYLKGKQTLLIVSHRESTVRDCDHVVYMESR